MGYLAGGRGGSAYFSASTTGKTANRLMNDQCKRSYTYTMDAGNATALLGNTPSAFGETWHLPTAKDPLREKNGWN